jgi:HSP20 family protein
VKAFQSTPVGSSRITQVPSRNHDTRAIDRLWGYDADTGERQSYIGPTSLAGGAAANENRNCLAPPDLPSEARLLQPATSDAVGLAPATDVFESDTALLFHIDAPGVDKADMELSLEEDTLVFRAKRHPLGRGAPTSFEKRLPLGREMDRDRIEASLRHGVLVVRVFKASNQAVPIDISSTDGCEELQLDDLLEL